MPRKILVAPVFGISLHSELIPSPEYYVFAVVKDGIALDDSGRAERFLYFPCYLLDGVFHEDGGVGVGLGHLFLALDESADHAVGDNDGLVLLGVGHFDGEHVDLALVDAELANIDVEEENVGTLHAGVDELGDPQLVGLLLAHYGGALLDAGDRVLAGHLHHLQPVLVRALVDLLRGPEEFHVLHPHAHRPPDLDEILPDGPDLLQVPLKLAVEHREVVGHPEVEDRPRLDHLVDVDGPQQPLGDVDPARGLKPIVAPDELLPPQPLPYQLLSHDLAPH